MPPSGRAEYRGRDSLALNALPRQHGKSHYNTVCKALCLEPCQGAGYDFDALRPPIFAAILAGCKLFGRRRLHEQLTPTPMVAGDEERISWMGAFDASRLYFDKAADRMDLS